MEQGVLRIRAWLSCNVSPFDDAYICLWMASVFHSILTFQLGEMAGGVGQPNPAHARAVPF